MRVSVGVAVSVDVGVAVNLGVFVGVRVGVAVAPESDMEVFVGVGVRVGVALDVVPPLNVSFTSTFARWGNGLVETPVNSKYWLKSLRFRQTELL